MKRKIGIGIHCMFTVFVCLLIFSGCSREEEQVETAETTETTDEYTLETKVVNPERTVEIANYLKDQASSGNQVFYDIYTEEEKAENPDKENTGLFFFRGEPGAKTAIVNAVSFWERNMDNSDQYSAP